MMITDSPKTECLQWLIAGESIKMSIKQQNALKFIIQLISFHQLKNELCGERLKTSGGHPLATALITPLARHHVDRYSKLLGLQQLLRNI